MFNWLEPKIVDSSKVNLIQIKEEIKWPTVSIIIETSLSDDSKPDFPKFTITELSNIITHFYYSKKQFSAEEILQVLHLISKDLKKQTDLVFKIGTITVEQICLAVKELDKSHKLTLTESKRWGIKIEN
jgi:hypothetical protein